MGSALTGINCYTSIADGPEIPALKKTFKKKKTLKKEESKKNWALGSALSGFYWYIYICVCIFACLYGLHAYRDEPPVTRRVWKKFSVTPMTRTPPTRKNFPHCGPFGRSSEPLGFEIRKNSGGCSEVRWMLKKIGASESDVLSE